MAFNKKAWMRIYMRAYRRGKRRRPRPGYLDKKAWSRPYMSEYVRKERATQKLERERDEAVNAAMARLSGPGPTASLSPVKIDARMADMRLLLGEVEARYGAREVNQKGPQWCGPFKSHTMWDFRYVNGRWSRSNLKPSACTCPAQ